MATQAETTIALDTGLVGWGASPAITVLVAPTALPLTDPPFPRWPRDRKGGDTEEGTGDMAGDSDILLDMGGTVTGMPLPMDTPSRIRGSQPLGFQDMLSQLSMSERTLLKRKEVGPGVNCPTFQPLILCSLPPSPRPQRCHR